MAGEFAYLVLTDETVDHWATSDHLAEQDSAQVLCELRHLPGVPFAVAETVAAAANEILRRENLLPQGKKLTIIVAN
jgi:hypothetical protein